MRVQQPGDRARFARSYGLSIVVHVLFFIFWFSLLAVRIEQGETAGDASSTRITLEARPVPLPAPSVVPSPAPHRVPTARPIVAKVTAVPLRTRPPSPRAVPTSSPPRIPTPEATLNVSFPPTYRPSAIPTSVPSPAPTAPPSVVAVVPTVSATPVPTQPPSPVPTAAPTATPRPIPTVTATQAPTALPQPTAVPTTAPPTAAPTAAPTAQPTTVAARTSAPSPAATASAATPGVEATSAASSAASPGRAGPPLRTVGPLATPIPHPVPPEVTRPAPGPAASPADNPNAASLEERMRRMLGGINEARHYDAKRYEGEVAAAVKRLAQEYDVSHRPPPPNSGVGTYVRAFNFALGQVLYALRVVNVGPLQVCAGWIVTFTPPNQPPNFYIGTCLKNGGGPVENSDPRERRPGGYPTVPPLHN